MAVFLQKHLLFNQDELDLVAAKLLAASHASDQIKYRNMKKFFFFFAATGWTLGFIVHLCAIADIDVSEQIPFVWVLHLGVFVVWLPAILLLNQSPAYKAFRNSGFGNRMNPMGLYKIISTTTPTWLIGIAFACFAYAFLNFMVFMSTQGGSPSIQDGQYVLHNHGSLIRTLTEQEYHHYQANVVRGFSGHWLAFYAMAAAMLYPFKKSVEPEEDQTKDNT